VRTTAGSKVMNICPCCSKKFQKQVYFRRHRACCEFIRQGSHAAATQLAELDDIPTREDLWRVVRVLGSKVSSLEKEVEDMRHWVRRQKQKLSVIEWLNANCKPALGYEDWKRSLAISQEDLGLIFKHGFVAGMFYIFQKNLSLGTNNRLPVRAFEQKPRVLFVRDEKEWRMLSVDEFRKLVCDVHLKVHVQFKVWRDRNEKMISNVHNNEEWHRNTSKVMGGKDTYDVAVRKINSRLYNYLKFNLRSILQYEFTF